MRKPLIAVLLVVTTLGGIVAQDSPMKPDGRMWALYGSASQQGILIKAAYVRGAIEGFRVGSVMGYMDGSRDEYTDALDRVKQCVKGACANIPVDSLIKNPDSLLKEWMTGADKERAKFSPQNGTPDLDIVRQMDKFYSDYRNTPVCMILAFQESVSSLKGTASTEQELQLMRKGCDPK